MTRLKCGCLCRKPLHLFCSFHAVWPICTDFSKAHIEGSVTYEYMLCNICTIVFTFSALPSCCLETCTMAHKNDESYSPGGTWFQCTYEIILSWKWKYYLEIVYWKTKQNTFKWEVRSVSTQAFCIIQNRIHNDQNSHDILAAWSDVIKTLSHRFHSG